MTDRLGPFMLTYSGRRFWPLDPRPEDVALEDIAHALSLLCRFGGHVRTHYSVAEHSVRIAHAILEATQPHPLTHDDIALALEGLCHDAAEAYVGDVIWPVKQALKPYFHAIEHKVDHAIRVRFGLSLEMPRSIKRYDLILLATEKRDLRDFPEDGSPELDSWLRSRGYSDVADFVKARGEVLSVRREKAAAETWGQLGEVAPLSEPIVPWTAAEAEKRFLDLARQLFREGTRGKVPDRLPHLLSESHPRYTTHRPYCMACTHPLEPARSISDGEPTFRGFHPCPDHPEATVVYPTIPPELL